ncbi:MAG: 6-phosphogluconolactonase [Actinomycetota bacterium]|nr:6-phosphogluconolactonase [Actinomycetota bacterium]
MAIEIEVLDDPARACAAMLVGASAGHGHVVLTGGSTPGAAYAAFADAIRAVGVDVSDTTFWFSDERCVAPDDERSNYRLVKQALLDRLGDQRQPAIRRIKGELGSEAGAEDYERELREADPRRFELILLGIGPDGHIASLFPDQSGLSEPSRLAIGVPEAGLEPYVPRVSLTLPALALGRRVVVLATGESKAKAVAAAFGRYSQPDPHVPASLLGGHVTELTVLLDRAAAQLLARDAGGAS